MQDTRQRGDARPRMQAALVMKAMELAVGSTGHAFPRLSILAEERVHTLSSICVPSASKQYCVAILDITLTEQNEVRLIEANGSNGGLTSIATGADGLRAEHMWLAFRNRTTTYPAAVILPFKPGFMHLPEFFARATAFASLIASERSVALRWPDEACGAEDVTVVCGPMPAVAQRIDCVEGGFSWGDRRVSFACNPNLLGELLRQGKIDDADRWTAIASSIFHDGSLVHVINNKARQQGVAEGTGISPLYCEEASSIEVGIDVVQRFHARGLVAVGKISAGSGGAGISFFPLGQVAAAIESGLADMVASATQHYGSQAARTAFPLRFFEFARSTDYLLRDGPHLWDLRVLCLVSPASIEVTPCLMRICPAPFDGSTYSREAVVSNLTGRPASLEFVRSAMDATALRAAGIDAANLTRMLRACAAWCEKAIQTAVSAR